MHRRSLVLAGCLTVWCSTYASGQSSEDTRTQYPALLQNSYITINVGAVNQPFSQDQLQPGFRAASFFDHFLPPVEETRDESGCTL